MARVDLNFDARSVQVDYSGRYAIDVNVEDAILDEVVASIGEDVILDTISVDKIISHLEEQGYTVEGRRVVNNGY